MNDVHEPGSSPRPFLTAALAGVWLAGISQAQLPDIEEVGVQTGSDWFNGVPQLSCFECEVFGTNLSSVEVLTPNGATHSLVYDPSDDEWRYRKQGFADLCAIENDPDVGFGTFVFTFNGGADQATVTYDPGSPTCATPPHTGFGALVSPTHTETNVDLYTTIQWTCSGGTCANFGWFIEVYDPLDVGVCYETDILDPLATSWTPPGCLTGGTGYRIYLGAGSFAGPIENITTTLGDAFVYGPGYETVNEITFDTRPPVGASYCSTSPNSAGPGATICVAGSRTASAQDVTLVASGCPEDVPGLFYFGPNQLPNGPLFGDGFRCVAVPGSQRIYPFATAGPMNGNPAGTALRPLNFGAPYAAGVTAGASLNFQFWYRDNAAMMSGFNLTDGVQVAFQ